MDEQLLRQIQRQLRVMNIMLVFFGTLIIVALAIGGYAGYKAYSQVKKAETSINKLNDFTNNLPTSDGKSTTDLEQQLCNSGGNLGALIKQQSTICN